MRQPLKSVIRNKKLGVVGERKSRLNFYFNHCSTCFHYEATMDAVGREKKLKETVKKFDSIANTLESNKKAITELLSNIEPVNIAYDEFDKAVKALRSYSIEIQYLINRKPYGSVAIFLPFNNPLYSFILYCFGPVLGGSDIYVRPSSITRGIFEKIIEFIKDELADLKVEILIGSGNSFINKIIADNNIKTVLFTGSWNNISSLIRDISSEKKFIYCGSGINPFIVGHDILDHMTLEKAVHLAIESRLYNSGQDCLCSERFYIHQDVVHQLITCLSEEVSKIKVGNFLNKDAVVCPLVDRIAQNLFVLCKSNEHRKWHIPFYHDKNLVFPSLVETSLNDKLLLSEKFGPVFTYAVFNDYDVLDKALDSDYLFGITVCGSYNSPIVKKYPHITNQTTVISYESDDAHIPFGGRLKSGFVREGKSIRDGPILYSVETTKKYKN